MSDGGVGGMVCLSQAGRAFQRGKRSGRRRRVSQRVSEEPGHSVPVILQVAGEDAPLGPQTGSPQVLTHPRQPGSEGAEPALLHFPPSQPPPARSRRPSARAPPLGRRPLTISAALRHRRESPTTDVRQALSLDWAASFRSRLGDAADPRAADRKSPRLRKRRSLTDKGLAGRSSGRCAPPKRPARMRMRVGVLKGFFFLNL